MQKNVAFFKRTEKNGAFRMGKNAVPNPATIGCSHIMKKEGAFKGVYPQSFVV